MNGAWSCDSCHTNNLAGATVCRVCGRQPGTSTGSVGQIGPPVAPPPLQQQTRPVFVESKHAPVPIALIPTAPVRKPAPPRTPVRKPMPPRPPSRPAAHVHGAVRTGLRIAGALKVLGVVAGLLLVIGVVARLGSDVSSSSSPSTPEMVQSTPTGTPCPTAAARWLQNGGQGAVLVAGYTTTQHVITVCRDAAGQLYYDGQQKGVAVTSDTHISIPAQATSTGFEATNLGYLYQITASEVIVSKSGKVLKRWPATRTG
jgi:hypothetical protein